MSAQSNLATTFAKIKFPAIFSKMNKKAAWGIIALLLLAVAGGAAYYQLIFVPSQVTSTTAAMQTTVVRQGDLVIYASGTGTLISANETDLAFTTGGRVAELLVEVGDKVEAGDLLAKVDDNSVEIAYTQAKRAYAELTSASAIATAQIAVSDAKEAVVSAQNHLEYVLGPNILYWENEVAKAESALTEAQAASDKNSSDKDLQTALQKAKDYLDYVQDKLSGAWVAYEEIYVPNHFTLTDRSSGQKYISAPSDTEIFAARADMAAAQATVQEAEYLYAALTGGEVPEDATGSGLSDLEQAKLDLEAAQDDLDGTQLYAPFAGTVMSVDMSVGDNISSGTTVITVADLDQPYLEVYLDESDWANVAVDYEVEVTFDILPERTFSGIVTQVDPGLYTESGTSVVRALVQLTNIDEKNFNLPLSTTAAVDVIGGRADNALLVPVEALHQAGDQYAVFVVEDGTPVLRVVEVGIQDLLYVEVTSGLNPGDVVTTGITETK
jgi:RND family efflux transporter MFP subunit